MTARNAYTIPRMETYIESLGTATVFSELDGNSVYWLIEIDERYRHNTGSVTQHGLFQLIPMSFRLRNTTGTLERAISIILATCKWNVCMVYHDDFIIFSKCIDDHVEHNKHVLRMMQEATMTVRLNNCFFMHNATE